MTSRPNMHIDGVQNTQQRETPGNAINDDLFTGGEELIDDSAQEQEMNQRPSYQIHETVR